MKGIFRHTPPYNLFAGMIGLTVALMISAILALPLSLLSDPYGKVVPAAVAVLLGYLGTSMTATRGKELFRLLRSASPRWGGGEISWSDHGGQILVDTSAIIDGRIADITHAGFIPGSLVIPTFVLDELQHIADSSDPLRRQRGRRGLEMLNRLQRESGTPVEISDADFEDMQEVDAKLVKLAQSLDCSVITNDFSLNRVAELQGVRVLNINQLAAAVKPLVMPGEEMEIRIIQEGKEFSQGVGFLDDGTMVVVEDGRRHLNSRVNVVVTRVLQTAVGRMIFAHLKNGAYRER